SVPDDCRERRVVVRSREAVRAEPDRRNCLPGCDHAVPPCGADVHRSRGAHETAIPRVVDRGLLSVDRRLPGHGGACSRVGHVDVYAVAVVPIRCPDEPSVELWFTLGSLLAIDGNRLQDEVTILPTRVDV